MPIPHSPPDIALMHNNPGSIAKSASARPRAKMPANRKRKKSGNPYVQKIAWRSRNISFNPIRVLLTQAFSRFIRVSSFR